MADRPTDRNASRRILAVFLTGLTLLIVALGAVFVFLATIVWSRGLDVRSAADEVGQPTAARPVDAQTGDVADPVPEAIPAGAPDE